MGEVIDILTAGPHLEGKAKCLHCNHEWQAVAPIGVFKELECPNCHLMKGVFNSICAPENFWTCECGCAHFFISGITSHAICANCGLAQKWG